jgi:Zn-finger nucleic acid-binding protein
LKIGARFRCRCGKVLTVQEPRGHDADVVCCAHCGAPRTKGALACEYCGADFTLHDRDLDTVCPHCFARVGHRDRFCHWCGARINPEMVAGEQTKLNCPACGAGDTLASRPISGVSALECNRCAGIWLGADSFRQLTDEAAKEGFHIDCRTLPPKVRAEQVETPQPKAVRYRPCAVCSKLMERRNYAHSGVIVDVCKDHGVWFDADELPRILDWIHVGGMTCENQMSGSAQSDVLANLVMDTLIARPSADSNHGAVEGITRWFFSR